MSASTTRASGRAPRSARDEALAELDKVARQLERAEDCVWESEHPPDCVLLEALQAIVHLHRALRAIVDIRGSE